MQGGGVVIAHLRMTREADERDIVRVICVDGGHDVVDVESAAGAQHPCPQHLRGRMFLRT